MALTKLDYSTAVFGISYFRVLMQTLPNGGAMIPNFYQCVAIHPEVWSLRIQRHQTVSCDLPLAPPDFLYF